MKSFRVLAVFLLFAVQTVAHSAAYDDFISAVKRGDAVEVSGWLKRGMDPNTIDPTGLPVLHLAARDGSLEAVKVILAAGANIDRRTVAGESALMLASIQGHKDVVNLLIQKEAQINHPGWTPLIYAATTGKTEIIKILIDNHAYIDSSSPNGVTSLMMAIRGGHVSAVRLLIEEDADVTVKNDAGETALDWAARASNTEMVRLIRSKLMP